jgi:Uma2 family endonuclease
MNDHIFQGYRYEDHNDIYDGEPVVKWRFGKLNYIDEPYSEIIDGNEIYLWPSPTTNHQEVCGNLMMIFCNRKDLRKDFLGRCNLFLDNDRLIPDGMIVKNRELIQEEGVYGAPNLVYEVLSPNTILRDRGIKKNLYENYGIPEYWIIDIENRSIEVYVIIDGMYELDNVYIQYPEYLTEDMEAADLARIPTTIRTQLYPELLISLNDVFEGLL